MTPERTLLETTELIAVVGLSNDPNKASHRVSEFMQHHGYKIVPVNPNEVNISFEFIIIS